MARLALIIACIFLALKAEAQKVILFQNFEGSVAGWMKSITTGVTDNEWFLLNNNSSLTTGNFGLGVSSGDGNNTYINTTSDHTAWVKPNWPAVVTDKEIRIQFDGYADGERAGGTYDQMELILADIDNTIVPSKATLNGGNSISLGYLADIDNWTRINITLNATYLNFIQNATNGATLVFSWVNDNDGYVDNPPAAIDNVLITSEPSAKGPLNGEYAIGLKNGEDFPTLTSAVNYLNNYGQSADVKFFLSDETYNTDFETFPLIIGDGSTTPYTGMGTYNLTIKPEPGTGVTPTVTGNNFTTANVGTLTLRAVNNITIDGSNTNGGTTKDLTIISNNNADTFVMPLFIAGANETNTVSNISVTHTNLSTNSQTKGYGIVAGLYGASTANAHFRSEARFDNLTINYNAIQSVKEAIHIDGVDRSGGGYTTNSLATNINIIGNDINTNIREDGIHLLGVDNGLVAENNIGNFNSTDQHTDTGIKIDKNSKNLVIEKNTIHNINFNGNTTSSYSGHGINVNSGLLNSNIEISNNEIYEISGNGANSTANTGFNNPAAIFLGLGGEAGLTQAYNQSGIMLYNNSIYMSGETMDFTTSIALGIAIAANTTSASMANNIIKNDLGGKTSLAGKASSLGVFIESNISQLAYLNHNAYHINSNSAYTNRYVGLVGSLANLAANGSASLPAWKTSTSSDLKSVYGDPGFTSATNLQPNASNANSWTVSGTGTHLSAITDDKAGTARPVDATEGAPDIGAFEFTANPSLSTPAAVVLNGPFSTGVTYTFEVNGLDRVEIYFTPGSDLPDALTLTFYSGVWPADPNNYSVSNNYFDIEASGDANNSYNFDMNYMFSPSEIGTVSTSDPNVHLANDANFNGDYKAMNSTFNTADYNIQATDASKYGRFTISSAVSSLPVTLIQFKGYENGNYNTVDWKTASELNNDYFVIEKSTDNMHWEFASKINGNGTIQEVSTYTWNDFNPSATTFYRLTQVDFDGTSETLKVIIVKRKVATAINIYPNPADTYVKVTMAAFESEFDYDVVDQRGTYIATGTLSRQASKIEVSNWKPGIYILIINTGESLLKEKIIVRH